ncbi:MAG: ABC transporter permease, partial [Clostridiales bacterium]|nr:ABC transporter permease [Clostridiales bacterium]
MKINTLGYSIKQGLKNIRRNLLFSLASVGTIVACLFLFGIFYSIVLN